jgi:hypothetical protein
MRALFAALALAVATTVAACGPRQVEVRTAPQQATDLSLHVTNNLSQAVNVYVTSGGTDIFLRQVGAGASEHMAVQGVAPGSSVTLKAVTVDNTRTYTKSNVTLSGMYEWQVP